MSIKLTAEDAEFLVRVNELGVLGRTQDEIAEALSIPTSTLRYRIRDLGFEWTRCVALRAKPQFGGKDFEQMQSDGEIVVAEAVAA